MRERERERLLMRLIISVYFYVREIIDEIDSISIFLCERERLLMRLIVSVYFYVREREREIIDEIDNISVFLSERDY